MPYREVQMHNPKGATTDWFFFYHQLKVRGTGAAKQKTTVAIFFYRPAFAPTLSEVGTD